MARAQGARAQLAAAFEAAYGTAPVSGYRYLPFVSWGLDSEQGLIESDLLGQGRDAADPGGDAINADGNAVVPLDLRNFGFWLKLLLGAPTTAEDGGVYTHVFGSGSWALPSLSAELGLPDVPHFGMASGTRIERLTLNMQRGGWANAALELVAQGCEGAASSAAGTPSAALEVERFTGFHGSVSRDGAALANIVSAQLVYANGLDRVETIRNDGKIDGLDPGPATLSGNLVARFANRALLEDAIDTPMTLTFAHTIGAGKSLTWAAERAFLPKPKITVEGPRGVQATFNWQGAKDSDLARMLTVTLVNDVETY